MGTCYKCYRDHPGIGLCGECERGIYGDPTSRYPSFDEYKKQVLSGIDKVAQLSILDSDLADLAYDIWWGAAFPTFDRRDACEYYNLLFEEIIRARLGALGTSGLPYSDYAEKFHRFLSQIDGTKISDESVLLLRKLFARSGLPHGHLSISYIRGQVNLFLLELICVIAELGLTSHLERLFKEMDRLGPLGIRDSPTLMVNLWENQSEALREWLSKGNGIVEMATATGKTIVGLAAIASLYERRPQGQQKPLRVLIATHTRAILDQWRSQIRDKLGLDCGEALRSTAIWIDFDTVQSLSKSDHSSWKGYDLAIFDEVHHEAAPQWRRAFLVPAQRKMGLSATVEGKQRIAILERELGPVVYSLSLRDAIEKGIIPRFDWKVHPTELAESERMEFREATDKITKNFQHVRSSKETQRALEEIRKKSVGAKSSLPESLRTIQEFIDAFSWARYLKVAPPESWYILGGLIQSRQWIIHRSGPKINRAIELLREYAPVAKCMVFTMDIETAERIYQSIPDVPAFRVHSLMRGEDQKRSLADFRESPNGFLVAPKILDEGIDVPDASVGINVAGTKTRLQLVQRFGRILRKTPGKSPVFHHFVSLTTAQGYIEGLDDVLFAEDLGWIRELGNAIGISPTITPPKVDAQAYEAAKKTGERELAMRFQRDANAQVSTLSGSIRFGQILEGVDPETARILLSYLPAGEASMSDEEWDAILYRIREDRKLPPLQGVWWLFIRYRDDVPTLRLLLEKRVKRT